MVAEDYTTRLLGDNLVCVCWYTPYNKTMKDTQGSLFGKPTRTEYQSQVQEENAQQRNMSRISFSSDYLTRFKKPTTKALHEYEDVVSRAAKMCGQRFIVMHKRVESAFKEFSVEAIIGYLNRWTHEAEKSDNPGARFNTRFKQFRELPKGNASIRLATV